MGYIWSKMVKFKVLYSDDLNTDLEKIQKSKDLFSSNEYKEQLLRTKVVEGKEKPSPKVVRV